MSLSRTAEQLAAEIRQHDWSDAPWRADRAGHQASHDGARRPQHDPLTQDEMEILRLNVAWVTGQVLAYNDSNFDIVEYAGACGVRERRPGILRAGLRGQGSHYHRPGTYDFDDEPDQEDLLLADADEPVTAQTAGRAPKTRTWCTYCRRRVYAKRDGSVASHKGFKRTLPDGSPARRCDGTESGITA